MPFHYPTAIAALTTAQKRTFYVAFIHELTIVVRVMLHDDISSDEKLDRFRWVNELIHSLANRLEDLDSEDSAWTEQDMWDLIRDFVSRNHAISGDARGAITRSYARSQE